MNQAFKPHPVADWPMRVECVHLLQCKYLLCLGFTNGILKLYVSIKLLNFQNIFPGSPTPQRRNSTLHLYEGKLYLIGGADSLSFPSRSLFSLDTQNTVKVNSAWKAVQQFGQLPGPSILSFQSSVIWGEQIWALGNSRKSANNLESPTNDDNFSDIAELHRFDFLSYTWSRVEQYGCLPDRRLQSTPFRGLHKTVTYGPYLLAFGCEQNDENVPPKLSTCPEPEVRKGTRQGLALHAFDFCSGVWTLVPTIGDGPSFTHCVAMALVEHRLIVIGHTPAAPSPLSVKRKANNAMKLGSGMLPASADPNALRICVLDLRDRSKGSLMWSEVPSPGGPTADACEGCASAVVDGTYLVLYGGAQGKDSRAVPGGGKCQQSGRGRKQQPSLEQLSVLDLRTWAWSMVDVPKPQAISHEPPSHPEAGPARTYSDRDERPGSRIGQCMCYVPQQQALYVVGGSQSTTEVQRCSYGRDEEDTLLGRGKS